MDPDVCLPFLHSGLDDDLVMRLMAALAPGTWDLFWQDSTLTQALASCCILRGKHVDPGAMVQHHLEEHCSDPPHRNMIRTFLSHAFCDMLLDGQCRACWLAFPSAHPDPATATTPHTLAHLHYQTTCPVIAQVACLISNPMEWRTEDQLLQLPGTWHPCSRWEA